MTDPHAPFLAAIIARPLDDLPRLIYADWLEATAGNYPETPDSSSGEMWIVHSGHAERAEFIRVQCKLADKLRGPAGPVSEESPWIQADMEYHALRRRERELLTENYGLRWAVKDLKEASWFVGGQIVHPWTWRRGFIDSVSLPWSDWRQRAAAIRAATPLRRVRLTTWPELGEVTADERRHVREVWPYEYEPDRIAILRQRYPGIEFELPAPPASDFASITGQVVFSSNLVSSLPGGHGDTIDRAVSGEQWGHVNDAGI